ncbi:hypothetical protein PGTUg99_034799 [Puccinia graminis f. sp. tritici]|uniref:Uncharacterized protein n=1 Tax=Puccinia graminis f. sp. tritici TaxID=56615 RepID=A0A5B0PM74_PUCGR|nr:hypothetical protein PGTUg99_034799 [Puccinia graminis f. sp. tritici]
MANLVRPSLNVLLPLPQPPSNAATDTLYTAVAGSWQFDHKLVDQFAGAVDRFQMGLRSAVKLAAKLAALLTAAARSN